MPIFEKSGMIKRFSVKPGFETGPAALCFSSCIFVENFDMIGTSYSDFCLFLIKRKSVYL
jgi:hypothetical protein